MRRLDQRHRLVWPVQIVADGVAIDAESIDLSLGGMCLHTDIAHGPGCPVALSVRFPGFRQPVRFTAAVAWRDRTRVGLAFTRVSALQLWTLSRVFPD